MSAYLKFLSHSEHYKLPVDLTAVRLLEIIACCARFEALTVTEAMSLQEVASPATLHRKLDDLMEANLIYQHFEGKNRRTKFLHPTQKALDHFENMSKAFMEVAEELRQPI
jgi:DNA-binding MarR family transcriptional regulator